VRHGQGAAARAGNAAITDAENDVVDAIGIVRRRRVEVVLQQHAILAEPVDIAVQYFFVVLVLRAQIHIEPVVEETMAEQGGDTPVEFAVLVELRQGSIELGPFEILAKHEVRDADDRVCAVHCRRAAGDDLDVLDEQSRNRVDIDRRTGEVGRSDVPAPVDEHERLVRAEIPQVEQAEAAGVEAAAGGVFRLERGLQRRQVGEVVDDVGFAGLEKVFTTQLNQRLRRGCCASLDARTGDDDDVFVGACLGRGRRRHGLLGLGDAGAGDRCCGGAEQQADAPRWRLVCGLRTHFIPLRMARRRLPVRRGEG